MNRDLFERFQLPAAIIGRAEVNQLYRETEDLDNFLRQDNVRAPGEQPKRPQQSYLLEQFCQANGINLLESEQRRVALDFLKYLKKQAPVLHISFAVGASPQFVSKITAWLRQNVQPQLLVDVGLAPGIKAGCLVRTTNKVFDFGLKKRFQEHRPELLERVRTLG